MYKNVAVPGVDVFNIVFYTYQIGSLFPFMLAAITCINILMAGLSKEQ